MSQPWFKDRWDRQLMFDNYQKAIEYIQKQKPKASIARYQSTRMFSSDNIKRDKAKSYGSTTISSPLQFQQQGQNDQFGQETQNIGSDNISSFGRHQ